MMPRWCKQSSKGFPMLIQLDDGDLEQMPPNLYTAFLRWLQDHSLKSAQGLKHSHIGKFPETSQQLTINVDNLVQDKQSRFPVSKLVSFPGKSSEPELPHDQAENGHVRFSQLFDSGIIAAKTLLRVRLTKENAKKLGRDYVTTGFRISPKGTVIFNDQEFDKPSPLATKVNGSSVNGWQYIEIKKNDQWVPLDELRKIWRNAS
jgi:hypothetical protein